MSPIIDLMRQQEQLFLSSALGNPVRIWQTTLDSSWQLLTSAGNRLACSVGHEVLWLFFLSLYIIVIAARSEPHEGNKHKLYEHTSHGASTYSCQACASTSSYMVHLHVHARTSTSTTRIHQCFYLHTIAVSNARRRLSISIYRALSSSGGRN